MAKRTRTKAHGGRRLGAGRPPLADEPTVKVAVTLLRRHVQKVERWQERWKAANFSAALRALIDAADAG